LDNFDFKNWKVSQKNRVTNQKGYPVLASTETGTRGEALAAKKKKENTKK